MSELKLSAAERRILNKAILSKGAFRNYVKEFGYIRLVNDPSGKEEPVSDFKAVEVAKECGVVLSDILPNKFKGERPSAAAQKIGDTAAAATAFNGSDNAAKWKQLVDEISEASSKAVNRLNEIDPEKIAEIARREAALYVNEKGGVTTRIEVTRGEVMTPIEGELYHRQFAKLLKYAEMRDRDGNMPNVMMFGGAGNGKTKAAAQLAEVLDLPFYQHNAVTYEHQLSGYINQMKDEFFETDLVRAYRDGGVVVLDENDRSENDAILPINGALADGYWTLPNGERLKRHKDCLIIATANTKGQGADREYVGANKLDKAYLSRFAVKIQWDRDEALETALLGDVDASQKVAKLRADINYYGIDYDVDTRQAKALSDALRIGFTMEEALEDIVYSMLTPDQIMLLKGDKKGKRR